MILAALAVCVGVVILCVQDIIRALVAPHLTPSGTTHNQEPRITVVVPARNEAHRIGACLDGLAQQRYRNFAVIVIDDHSTDNTIAVVQAYAAGLPALRLIPGAALPQGWAGKCWACWQAAQAAQSDWLLFLDADVVPLPDLLAELAAQTTRADAITLLPLQRFGSLAERLLLPAFHTILYGVYPLHLVSDPRSPIGFFNGPAIFIHQGVYEATGGHQSVRDSVLEDADYGRHVKNAGYRILAADAPDLLAIRMYQGWSSVCEGLGKNAVAGFRSGGWRSGWVGFRQTLIAFAPLYLVGAGAALWWQGNMPSGAALLGSGVALLLVTTATTAWLFRRRHRISPWWALAYPLGLTLYFALAMYAFLRVKTGRGVVWKGRVLPGG